MTLVWDLSIRLVGAALIGAAIGYERELRAKGAGVRTHVLVALGAALFMVVSQFGFEGADKFDAARVAAGVVSGIGFLGGGLIIKKNHISGLTTAAGLWVTGALGLAMGSGMYIVSGVTAVMVLLVMECLSFYKFKFGIKEVDAVFTSTDEKAVSKALESFGKHVKHFSLSKQNGVFRLDTALVFPKKMQPFEVLSRLESIEGVELESME
ncbi:MAG: MgtC/SapB family protein [Bacteroidales bacterium]|nr:MgtC/SapB family protein [Bacteroidales bacterium]